MSVEITTAFRQEYKSGIEMLVQQMSSKMRGAVREEAISSKRAFFDQIGAVAATEAGVDDLMAQLAALNWS